MGRLLPADCHGGGLVVSLSARFSTSPLTAQQVDVWSRPVQTERSRTHDFIHYRVSLTFDLDQKIFWGENRITLTPFADGLDQFEVDAEEIIIEAATGPGGEELPFQRSDTSVVVSLPDPPTYGDTIEVTLAYRGENPQEGFFFDDASDDHPQMVSTDSWPNEAHHWIPLFDYPNDKVTHELIITVPDGKQGPLQRPPGGSHGGRRRRDHDLALGTGASPLHLPHDAGHRPLRRHRGLVWAISPSTTGSILRPRKTPGGSSRRRPG